ncbi:hypothetical protein O7631_07840 [Micromonospora sp. WMMD967]|uniref:hypothetical protein n=1 Tax=Micromonospora sp. WMMD967 TaxID=3016101 RepID=UPI002416F3BD|nr:hypothetical protein [Micromonospora sp. WMMD967]MDG4836426.1 hypothetical protein [Micromonospora sp. WMMD967]
MRSLPIGLTVAAVLALTAALAPAASAAPMPQPDHATTRVSVSSDEVQGNARSAASSVSRTGRFVSFESGSTNLVPGDTNGTFDIFARDRLLGTTALVSLSNTGTQGNDVSFGSATSGTGRYVAFISAASNLVPGDTNGALDIFVRDRLLSTTSRVSLPAAGGQGNSESTVPSISYDGRYVSFTSYATNLVPGDTNGVPDVFVRDRLLGTTTRVSVSSSGAQGSGPSGFTSTMISGAGRYVIFYSEASNLVPGDTNGVADIFVRDLLLATTIRVSVSSAAAQGDGDSSGPAISADGRFAAFSSWSSNLVPGDTNGYEDVFVRDLLTGVTRRVSVASDGAQADGHSNQPALSGDGLRVAFVSTSSNLVPGDTNFGEEVFRHEWPTGTTTRLSVSAAGEQANDRSNDPSIDYSGRFVPFTSYATNLVFDDTNNSLDVFVRDAGQANTQPPPG